MIGFSIAALFCACGVYNFTGGDVGNAKTFQVNFFQNNAPIVEPGLDRDFTLFLQDLILNQTNLALVNANGDLLYEGEIVEYYISPMSATAQQTASQNRLTIGVNVRFSNKQNPEKDFQKRFSFFYDFPAAQQINQVKNTAFQQIFERIGQDIFNASLANW
jgi:hypothetical protein